MARISKTERTLNLISFLLKSPVPVPWSEIKGKVVGYDDKADTATMERRFERDKEFLRALGIPLEYIPLDKFGNTGYFIEKADYYLPKVRIAPEDVAAIDLVSRMSLGNVGPLREALQSALQKLQIDFPAPFGIDAEAEERKIKNQSVQTSDPEGSENLDLLFDAVLNAKRVRFRYYTMGRDATSEREVEPYGLGFTRGAWYLAGRCLTRKDIRVFRIARIRGPVHFVHPDGEQEFQIPADFRLSNHIGKPAWQLDSGEAVEVQVRLDSHIAWMAARSIGTADSFEGAHDGSGVLTLRVTAVEPFIRWVLSFAHHATVLSPPWLRKRLCETVGGVAEMYTPSS